MMDEVLILLLRQPTLREVRTGRTVRPWPRAMAVTMSSALDLPMPLSSTSRVRPHMFRPSTLMFNSVLFSGYSGLRA